MKSDTYVGDCLDIVKNFPSESVDLIYLDPPFFTQKNHKLITRDRTKEFNFSDTWPSISSYSQFLSERLIEFKRLLKQTGSLFFHCDRNASHIARLLLDEIFTAKMFRSEIIWYYRRWSNSKRDLLPTHQNIYFYSKTNRYKFHELSQDYSPSTNLEQILQKRARDKFGVTVYARNDLGEIISSDDKRGVPLNDVWDLPYLNPKAKERIGYPTQKPILLLKRIIELVTDKNDLVLDPFCGSGTTLVASQILERNCIGIDISNEAIDITQRRLKNPKISRSFLLEAGRESYNNVNKYALTHLVDMDYFPVHRNKGIDAMLKSSYKGYPIFIRVQRKGESLDQAINLLYNASLSKKSELMILISTEESYSLNISAKYPEKVLIVNSTSKSLKSLLSSYLSG